MMRILTLCLTLLAFMTTIGATVGTTTGSGSAQAASLDELRASGSIGERHDGFAVVRNDAPGAADIVEQVNVKRRRIYKTRAKQQGISAAQVGAVYAKQIYGNAPDGTWFQSEDGSWRRK